MDNTTEQETQIKRHPLAHPTGGLILVDEGNVIPKAFKSVMKKVAGKMAKGEFTNLMKTPAPSIMHHHRSYLEGAAADLSYASHFLTKAAEAKDPMERLKNVLCLYVGGHHINVSQL